MENEHVALKKRRKIAELFFSLLEVVALILEIIIVSQLLASFIGLLSILIAIFMVFAFGFYT